MPLSSTPRFSQSNDRSFFPTPWAILPLLIGLLAGPLLAVPALAQDEEGHPYEATYESLGAHEAPEWFHDAKLGIFIHWGVYAVPAWAPRGEYAEWYPARYGEPGSPTYEHHNETYGADVEYEDFVSDFRAENWDPERWAQLFKDAGARYVIPVAEHHDGFPMWDSRYTDWDAADKGPQRDIIGDLAEAVRAEDMRFGASYHAMLNYYTPKYSGPHPAYLSDDYVRYMNAKARELIDEYRPSVLWLDGDWEGTPETFESKELIAYYYNQAAERGQAVAVNDRWGKSRGKRGDFYTQEYEYDVIDQLIGHKWENTRGMGHSFGYNANEPESDHMSLDALVDLFVDNVSKNANLLLNVGPKADGTIPEVQRELLRGLGEWLDVHGEGIYGTRPWVEATGTTPGDSLRVRFTQKQDTVYAFLLDHPSSSTVTIPRLDPADETTIRVLGRSGTLEWTATEQGLRVELPSDLPERPAHALAITPEPWRLMRSTQ
jgi:alpha-L-fucosidase